MNRADLIKAGMDAAGADMYGHTFEQAAAVIGRVIDAVQPLIQGEMVQVTRAAMREEILLDLHRQVEELHDTQHAFGFRALTSNRSCCGVARVLALLDAAGAQ